MKKPKVIETLENAKKCGIPRDFFAEQLKQHPAKELVEALMFLFEPWPATWPTAK